ncbi:uncharacterized protein LY89DRAFT_708514 [Mollisia scopiformis]|uniref:Uncharacterized protein n=1 Tax=Mollisia scopiformis TaxID=149040 RepID=A0A194X3Z9_MOLSC|nr:uncharacterized protein LY89DRAFT_708514 [Mollisia scopiformis]KUJ14915.1 hypothetical protein LY89DRAFT_708514 [Mollisia scopiformis]
MKLNSCYWLRIFSFLKNSCSKIPQFKMASDKKLEVQEQGLSSERESDLAISHGEVFDREDIKSTGLLGRLVYYEEWLDRKLGYGLSLTQAILIIIFGTFLGCAVAGWCATLGPGTGLRQVAISRYSFGWWPSKIIAILNVVEQIGWAAVGCITGGQALSAVSNYTVSVVLGIVIINIISIVLSFGGYTAIVKIENYFWIVFFVIFLIIYGEVGGKADLQSPAQVTGMTLSGNVLSCIAIFYGDGASYASIISDYYVNYPANISKMKVWLLTTFGIFIPVTFGILLGSLVGSTTGVDTNWGQAYDNHGVGGLILAMLYPAGFAKFLLVLLSLGGVGLNVIAIYSSSLAIQQAAKLLQRVPRFVWSLVTFACILVLSVGGRDKIIDFLENFLSLLGYYNTAFVAILAIEHYYFRNGNLANYDLDGWNTPSRLPIGFAGLTSFLLGIVGAILGMVETYYVGIIAKMIGEDGGDIGNELALVFTVISYPTLRKLELKYVGR